jgi:hypothetical protein
MLHDVLQRGEATVMIKPSPAMALWSCRASPQKASLPNVSVRKICLP